MKKTIIVVISVVIVCIALLPFTTKVEKSFNAILQHNGNSEQVAITMKLSVKKRLVANNTIAGNIEINGRSCAISNEPNSAGFRDKFKKTHITLYQIGYNSLTNQMERPITLDFTRNFDFISGSMQEGNNGPITYVLPTGQEVKAH